MNWRSFSGRYSEAALVSSLSSMVLSILSIARDCVMCNEEKGQKVYTSCSNLSETFVFAFVVFILIIQLGWHFCGKTGLKAVELILKGSDFASV